MVRRLVFWFLVGKISLVALCSMAFLLYVTLAALQHYTPTPDNSSPTLQVMADGPVLAARAYAIFDVGSGALLAVQDADTPYPIASVTKLPAAAAAETLLPLDATTTLTWSDVAAEGRAGKLAPGATYSYRELVYALLLESSNDAAAAFEREHRDELLLAMQSYAAACGASSTTFADLSGLSADNTASARDLALLTTRLYAAHPFVFNVGTLSQYLGAERGWVNNNPVAQEEGYLGGKHGYTEAAGRTIVALFDEPFVAGRRQVGYVVLGSSDLRADVAALRQYVHTSVRFQ